MRCNDGRIAADELLEREARDLVRQADGDPASVRTITGEYLDGVADPLSHVEALHAWALGLALRHQRELPAAESWLQRAALVLDVGSDDHTGVTLTLSGTQAFLGRFDDAQTSLDSADPSPAMLGRVRYQRAALTERIGDQIAARRGYSESIEAFRAAEDTLGEAHALCGLGLTQVAAGEALDAVASFGLARSLYLQLRLPMLAAVARNNLGFAATRAGDIIAALEHLTQAEQELRHHGEPFAETALDHVEALLVAGFPDDAADRALAVLPTLTAGEVHADRAEMLLGLGRALAASNQASAAHECLQRAEQVFIHQGRPQWERITRLRRLETETDPSDHTLASVLALRVLIQGDGDSHHAADADAVGLDIAHRLGDSAVQREIAKRLSELPTTDARGGLGRCFCAEIDGDLLSAERTVNELLRPVGRGVRDVSSLDVRVGIAAQHRSAVRSAIRTAVHVHNADAVARIVALGQRSVIRSHRTRSVDPAMSDELIEALRSELSSAEWREIAERVRIAGEGDVPTGDIVTDVLAGSPVIIVVDQGDSLVVAEVVDGTASFLDAPSRAEVLDAFRRFESLLHLSVSRPNELREARQLDASGNIVQTLLPWLGSSDSPIALCATGELAGRAWSAAAGRPVRVVAELEAHDARPRHSTSAIVAGPDLHSAHHEIAALNDLLTDTAILSGPDATPARTLSIAADVDTLHLACHATHNSRNPLLSSYLLDGGNLTGFEIDRRARAPRTVVAAACRAGAASSHAGQLALSTVTAWLSAGADSVVAPNVPIPDDKRTVAAMVGLHEGLLDGHRPEVAVFNLRDTGDPTLARAFQVAGRRSSMSTLRPTRHD